MAITIAKQMARVIGDRIISGELVAGAMLRQDHIADEFDASHVPAREALQLLCAQGLAVSLPRRGVRVAPLDEASIRETIDIRVALETLALRCAAPKINAVAYQKIELALVAGDQALNIVEWEQANRRFHRELVTPCRMPRLLSMIDDLQLINARIVFSKARSAGWRPGSRIAHRRIVDALRKRNCDLAVSLLDAHIRGLERTALDMGSF